MLANNKRNTKMGWNLENTYALLPKMFYQKIELNPVFSPKLVLLNNNLAESLGLKTQGLVSDAGIAILAGNNLPEGSLPLAQAYAGHQFGYFTMLGDGRALMIGEQITPLGKRFDIQLKGSGQTPFSRSGDGRATLGPMLREYIISEAMYALGIPTSRSLAVIASGELVQRETKLPGAILARVATSHIRVGTFEYASKWGSVGDVKAIADYVLHRHFDYIDRKTNPYLSLLQEVVKLQAQLIAKWQLVGFIHGVMNTDNVFLSGETIDYGPCAFMDVYDPGTVFSSIDQQGRYAYANQPYIATWNLARFAETLIPLLDVDQKQATDIANEAVSNFALIYQSNWLQGMRAKLGLYNVEEQDEALIQNLLSLMQKHKADYTNTFINLTFDETKDIDMFSTTEFQQWQKLWLERLSRQSQSKAEAKQKMQEANPALIPRNHRVEEALTAAVEQADYTLFNKFLGALSKPYEHSTNRSEYQAPSFPSCEPYQTYCGT